MEIYTITYIYSSTQVKSSSEKDNPASILKESIIDNKTPVNTVLVVCGKCNHEFNMQLGDKGNHIFGSCPKCDGPVSSQYDQKGKKFSPAQSAAENLIKKYT